MAIFLLSSLISMLSMLLIISLTALTISLSSTREKENDLIKIEVTAWFKLIRIQTQVPLLKLKENLSGWEYKMEMESQAKQLNQQKTSISFTKLFHRIQSFQQFIQKVYEFNQIMRSFFKHVYLHRLEWKVELGTGDAAETGLLTGLSWGIMSSIAGLISSYVTLRTLPRLNVIPSFQQKKLETEFKCMFRLRIGHAILAGVRILLNLRKRRDVRWQSTQFKA